MIVAAGLLSALVRLTGSTTSLEGVVPNEQLRDAVAITFSGMSRKLTQTWPPGKCSNSGPRLRRPGGGTASLEPAIALYLDNGSSNIWKVQASNDAVLAPTVKYTSPTGLAKGGCHHFRGQFMPSITSAGTPKVWYNGAVVLNLTNQNIQRPTSR